MAKFSKAIKQAAETIYKDSDSKARKRAAVAKMQAKKKILRDDYKPKLKNEKEVYSNNLKFAKQDYSDTIKNYKKTQQRKKRNRAGLVSAGASAAAAIQSRKDKQNKK